MKFFTAPKHLNDTDDNHLLNSYRESGDLAVLGKLYEKQMPLVYGVCLKYLKDEEFAKDAVMGIFEQLIDKAKQHDIQQFKNWLYVLSRNYCLMQLRAGKKLETVSLDDFMEFNPILHPDDNNREAALKALERCMDKLPAAQKQSIDLFYYKDQCYKDITYATGFTLNEVKSYIQNGKRNLKICLGRIIVSKQDTDISQIKEYLNGELDSGAMHQLERRAQSDPFLMDALAGYEGASGKDLQPQLDELSARLKQRIAQKQARVIPFTWFAVAASVLIVFAAGGIWYFNKQTVPVTIATVVNTPKITQTPPVIDTASVPERESKIAAVKQGDLKSENRNIKKTTYNKSITAEPITTPQIANASVKTPDTAADETPLDEMIVMDLAAKKRKTNPPTTNSSVATMLQGKAAGVAITKNSIKGTVISRDNGLPVVGALVKLSNSPVETFTDPNGHFILPADSGKAKLHVAYYGYTASEITVGNRDSVKIALQPNATMLNEVAVTGYKAQRKKDITGSVAVVNTDKFSPQNVIRGKVIDKNDGLPIPGALVRLKGSAAGTQTDANGRFALKADTTKTKLIVNYIGYLTLETDTKKRDSLQTLAMVPAQSSLNEVVVTGYSSSKNTEEPSIIDAHPAGGWNSFSKYLHQNAKAPDGIAGVVKVMFTVSQSGELSDVKVIKSLSPAADKKAIYLITNGPAWAGSTSGKSEQVSVRVRFVK